MVDGNNTEEKDTVASETTSAQLHMETGPAMDNDESQQDLGWFDSSGSHTPAAEGREDVIEEAATNEGPVVNQVPGNVTAVDCGGIQTDLCTRLRTQEEQGPAKSPPNCCRPRGHGCTSTPSE